MSRVANQEYPPLQEVIGHELYGLPVRDVHKLDGQIGCPDSLQDQALTTLRGVVTCGLPLGRRLPDHKHPAILIGDQEEALDI